MAMRYHKAIPFLVAVGAMQIIAIATNCSCPTAPTDVAVEFIGLNARLYDNGGASPSEPVTGEIEARALALQVEPRWIYSERTFSLYPPPDHVYGCPAPPELYHHLDTIASAEVTRLEGAGEGRKVSDAFVVAKIDPDIERTFGSIREFTSLPGMLNGDGFQHLQADNVRSLQSLDLPIVYLLLRRDIDAMKGEYVRFIVRLTLTDGRSWADTTDPITLH